MSDPLKNLAARMRESDRRILELSRREYPPWRDRPLRALFLPLAISGGVVGGFTALFVFAPWLLIMLAILAVLWFVGAVWLGWIHTSV